MLAVPMPKNAVEFTFAPISRHPIEGNIAKGCEEFTDAISNLSIRRETTELGRKSRQRLCCFNLGGVQISWNVNEQLSLRLERVMSVQFCKAYSFWVIVQFKPPFETPRCRLVVFEYAVSRKPSADEKAGRGSGTHEGTFGEL
jgi:hypothetical protein